MILKVSSTPPWLPSTVLSMVRLSKAMKAFAFHNMLKCGPGVASDENRRHYTPSHDRNFSSSSQTDARIGSKEALRLFEIELAKLKQMGKPEQSTNDFTQVRRFRGRIPVAARL